MVVKFGCMQNAAKFPAIILRSVVCCPSRIIILFHLLMKLRIQIFYFPDQIIFASPGSGGH